MPRGRYLKKFLKSMQRETELTLESMVQNVHEQTTGAMAYNMRVIGDSCRRLEGEVKDLKAHLGASRSRKPSSSSQTQPEQLPAPEQLEQLELPPPPFEGAARPPLQSFCASSIDDHLQSHIVEAHFTGALDGVEESERTESELSLREESESQSGGGRDRASTRSSFLRSEAV
jgi:hypothetical protein